MASISIVGQTDYYPKESFSLLRIYQTLRSGTRDVFRAHRDALYPIHYNSELDKFCELYHPTKGHFRNLCRIVDPMAMIEWAKTFRHEIGGWTWSIEDIAQLELAITLDMAGG